MPKVTLVLGGAGPSTEVTKLLAKEFCKVNPQYTITVPGKSIKHAGGLQWATDNNQQVFGRLGRPISESDRKKFPTARQLPIAKVKLAFAARKDAGVSDLTFKQWQGIMSGEIQNWQLVGGQDRPIMLLGREKSEASLCALISRFPFMGNAPFKKIYKKDHHLISALKQTPGSVGFADEKALKAHEELVVLRINGFRSSQIIPLAYDVSNETSKVVKDMKAFVQKRYWHNTLFNHGYLPPPPIQ